LLSQSIYVSIIVPFSRHSKLFVENRNFFWRRVYLAPTLRMAQLEFQKCLWRQ